MWNEAEYLFMQSIVELELNDIVMNASLIVMCISTRVYPKVPGQYL